VSELGDLLELLHGAAGRVSSVQSRWRLWRDEERVHAAFMAHAKQTGGRTYTARRAARGGGSTEHTEEVRFWWQSPASMREQRDTAQGEGAWTGQPNLVIRVGATWWSYSPQTGALTNGGDERHSHGAGDQFLAMLDPCELIGVLDFTVVGRGQRAGRPVVVVVCRPRLGDRRGPAGFALHHLGLGADEHVIEVEADRGVLLRAEARLEGQALQITEAAEIAFDTRLDPGLFRFEPPAGEELHRVDVARRIRHDVPIHEAVGAVPFTVYTLGDAPADWRLTVTVHAGLPRPLVHANVGLHYRSRDATAQVNVSQMAADTAEDYSLPEGEDVEHDGRPMRVRRRTEDWPQAQLSTTLGDTLVVMSSETLTADDLIELVTRLKPASSHPPQI
jgi:outer membrane lipoprotein-sorting protein